MIKRKVVCVFGEWGENTDFVLEPATEDDEDYFYIQEVKPKKKQCTKK